MERARGWSDHSRERNLQRLTAWRRVSRPSRGGSVAGKPTPQRGSAAEARGAEDSPSSAPAGQCRVRCRGLAGGAGGRATELGRALGPPAAPAAGRRVPSAASHHFPHRESAREEPARAGGGCGEEARGRQEGWIARALSERPADRNRYPAPVGGPAPGAPRRGASDRCSRAGMRVLRWQVQWMRNVPVTQPSAGATGRRGFERSEPIWLVV